LLAYLIAVNGTNLAISWLFSFYSPLQKGRCL